MEGVHRATGPSSPRWTRKEVAPRARRRGAGGEAPIRIGSGKPRPVLERGLDGGGAGGGVALTGALESEGRGVGRCMVSGQLFASRFFSHFSSPRSSDER